MNQGYPNKGSYYFFDFTNLTDEKQECRERKSEYVNVKRNGYKGDILFKG